MTLTPKSQAGGYYQVTAKAKSGITCYLDVNTPSVSFGSDPEGVASPVGQGGEDPIKLTGSAVAYTGISPKTTKGDAGVEFENVIVSVTDEDPNPAELALPERPWWRSPSSPTGPPTPVRPSRSSSEQHPRQTDHPGRPDRRTTRVTTAKG
ncbi:hypothetical protein ACFQVA_17795 [Actinomadura keratinilytica]